MVNLRLLIREQNHVIAKAYAENDFNLRKTSIDWESLVSELEIWTQLKNISLVRPWIIAKHNVIKIVDAELYTDASSSQMGSCLKLNPDDDMFESRVFRYTINESTNAIHVKEALVIYRALVSHCTELKNCRVLIKCDNSAVVHAWRNYGCRDMKVNRIFMKIFSFCAKNNIKLQGQYHSTIG